MFSKSYHKEFHTQFHLAHEYISRIVPCVLSNIHPKPPSSCAALFIEINLQNIKEMDYN
jgi:hypothetical protein